MQGRMTSRSLAGDDEHGDDADDVEESNASLAIGEVDSHKQAVGDESVCTSVPESQ